MSALDTIFNFFKSAHPDAEDADIHSYIDSLKASPDQMSSAAAPLSMDKAPDMALKFPDVSSTPSNFDTSISDNTVTENGSAPSVTAAPAEVPPPPAAPPVMPPPAPTANQVDNSDAAKDAASVAAPSPDQNAGTDALKAALSPQKPDAKEAEFLAQQKKKKAFGAIPVTIAGIGDALGNAAKAVGGSANTNAAELAQEHLDTNLGNEKKTFEEQQRKDPTSDISRHYQKVLGLMLGKHADGMNVDKMSAENIASTLPEVEKYMQKELGMQQIKSNKDLQMAMHEQGRQDKLEKDAREWVDNLSKARNGEIGVQNAKVDQARHLLQAYKQAEESGKPFSNATYNEIAVGLANLMSSGGQTDAQTRHNIAQATAQGDFNKALTFLGLDPTTLGGTTQAVAKNLKDSILRQGLEAENQRDKFINDQKQFIPSGLDPAKADKLSKANFGNSMKEFLPQNQPKQAAPKASAPEGAVKTIGTRHFTVMNGMWHEIQ